MLFDEFMTFCKTCGALAVKGCPKGHDSTLNDKIKDVIRAEDGTRVLISYDNADLGKEFRKYMCKHNNIIYVLKVQGREPADFLRISFGINPCTTWREHTAETYNLRSTSIHRTIYEENEAERSLKQAEMNLENWTGSSKNSSKSAF